MFRALRIANHVDPSPRPDRGAALGMLRRQLGAGDPLDVRFRLGELAPDPNVGVPAVVGAVGGDGVDLEAEASIVRDDEHAQPPPEHDIVCLPRLKPVGSGGRAD